MRVCMMAYDVALLLGVQHDSAVVVHRTTWRIERKTYLYSGVLPQRDRQEFCLLARESMHNTLGISLCER